MILSRQSRIYASLWRKALAEDSLVLNLDTHAQAMALRLALYRFLKPYRKDGTLDPVLTDCADTLAVCIKHRSKVLTIKRKVDIDLAEIAMLAAGVGEDELLTEGEKKMLDLSGGIEEVEQGEKELMKPNPFYTKEER